LSTVSAPSVSGKQPLLPEPPLLPLVEPAEPEPLLTLVEAVEPVALLEAVEFVPVLALVAEVEVVPLPALVEEFEPKPLLEPVELVPLLALAAEVEPVALLALARPPLAFGQREGSWPGCTQMPSLQACDASWQSASTAHALQLSAAEDEQPKSATANASTATARDRATPPPSQRIAPASCRRRSASREHGPRADTKHGARWMVYRGPSNIEFELPRHGACAKGTATAPATDLPTPQQSSMQRSSHGLTRAWETK
jgi:hypothetical protein